jgi:hypothetical protein
MMWISVEQQLPRELEEVLIWREGLYAVALRIRSLKDPRCPGGFMDPEANQIYPFPTHWMHLPAPPTAEPAI